MCGWQSAGRRIDAASAMLLPSELFLFVDVNDGVSTLLALIECMVLERKSTIHRDFGSSSGRMISLSFMLAILDPEKSGKSNVCWKGVLRPMIPIEGTLLSLSGLQDDQVRNRPFN